MALRRRDDSAIVFQLEVILKGTNPPIWRRFEVPETMTLAQLHAVLQTVMGWTDSHLHLFRIGDRSFAPHGDLEPLGEDTRGVRLAEIAPREGSRLIYEYDFGDGWTHDIVVESVDAEPCVRMRCVKGKRRCTPEDSGGPWGYRELLEARIDPRHERHAGLAEWIDHEFDPEEFDAEIVNRELGRRMEGR
ncbi:MAG: plasmid pRiA4b ORF-3 family protein [Thermomicrobiales bacterium]|nr:plasmid pRiA4b ORF-3 family protein [Thermomicrobiales bacterium]